MPDRRTFGSLLAALLFLAPTGVRDGPEGRPYGLATRPRPAGFPNLPTGSGPFPARLSLTGVFRDTVRLVPDRALIPYDLNTPFWSDGAVKRRWIALPPPEAGRIAYSAQGEWTFPPGTVFVKHFEIASDETRPEFRRRLETRLLVVDRQGRVSGASYRWRDDLTDADLVTLAVPRAGRLSPVPPS
jgi:hypothetical protein